MTKYNFDDLARLALADHCGLLSDMQGECLDDIVEQSAYNDSIFECDGEEWLIYSSYSEAENAAKEYIKETLWAFNADFLAGETGFDADIFEAIRANDKCESNNDAILSLVEGSCGFDSFTESAIGCDGVGHFLSNYDGDEVELVCPLTNDTFYAYRNN